MREPKDCVSKYIGDIGEEGLGNEGNLHGQLLTLLISRGKRGYRMRQLKPD
jgi:hypothetical protein